MPMFKVLHAVNGMFSVSIATILVSISHTDLHACRYQRHADKHSVLYTSVMWLCYAYLFETLPSIVWCTTVKQHIYSLCQNNAADHSAQCHNNYYLTEQAHANHYVPDSRTLPRIEYIIYSIMQA